MVEILLMFLVLAGVIFFARAESKKPVAQRERKKTGRQQVVEILRSQFGFEPQTANHQRLIDDCLAHAQSRNGNSYDAAIVLVLAQVLAEHQSKSDLNRNDVIRDIGNMFRLLPKATMSKQEVQGELAEVAHDLDLDLDRLSRWSDPDQAEFAEWLDDTFQQYAHPTFENWLSRYKEECARINPQLHINEGMSAIDFMEQEPLRRAHRDGVKPEDLAREWAPTFDFNTFGKN